MVCLYHFKIMIDCGASIMELEYIGRQLSAPPFLARMQGVEKIYDMARDKSPQARRDLMQVVCSILQARVSVRESELVADVLIELLRQAERDLRMALSIRLSAMEDVPLRLVLQLANDEIDIARPILRDSPVLGEFDLVYIIKSKGAEYWQAIAQRKQLTSLVMDTLVETKDFATALAMLQNNSIELSEHVMLALSDLARGSDVLSAPLLRRKEITKDIIDSMYMVVGESLKEYIREHHSTMSVALVNAVDKTVQSFVLESEGDAHQAVPDRHADNEIVRAKDMMSAGKLDVNVMIETLRMSQLKVFKAQLSVFSGMNYAYIDDLIRQTTGQKLALVCKAHDINKADFVSIFLLTAKARDFGRLADVRDITKAIAYYERVTKPLAQAILQGQAGEHDHSDI